MTHLQPPAVSWSRPPLIVAWSSVLTLPLLAGGGPGTGEVDAPAPLAEAAQEVVQAPPVGLREALTGGDWWLKLRLRYEEVDQEGIDEQAHGLTLRTVLGYETARWNGLSALLEFEDVTAIPNDNAFNSTVNGETDRPVIADPDGTEVNQAFLRYGWTEGLETRIGRQRITFDNLRFVGNVGWRQNEQTFDAAVLDADFPGNVHLVYGYVENANRINGDSSSLGNARQASHLVHLEQEYGEWGRLSVYDYYLDFDSSAFLGVSTNSLGGRFTGKRELGDDSTLTGALEYAHQTDVGDNPDDVDADYWLAELGGEFGALSAGLGWETLGGDGDTAFQTPFATAHAFNGWADLFLVTPDDGLQDLYLQLGARISKGRLNAIWHEFDADHGGDHYGSELNVLFTWPLAKDLTFGVTYADYFADDYATDTRKAWLWLETAL